MFGEDAFDFGAMIPVCRVHLVQHRVLVETVLVILDRVVELEPLRTNGRQDLLRLDVYTPPKLAAEQIYSQYRENQPKYETDEKDVS